MKDEDKAIGLRRFILHPSSFILFLTLLAAILRFMFLGRPAIWGDEAMTFARACGTWRQLLEELAITGFTPLHYMLLWAIGQVTPLTPFFMRLVPAVAGTLMVPAIYALAVQIVSRPTALLVALFTATNSFLLAYARDAKMYADFWLLVTLSTACLLWWLRTRSYLGWCLWLLSNIAMVATQALGLAMLPVQLVLFLSHRRVDWKPAIFFVLGIGLTVGPVLAYYWTFNTYRTEIDETGWPGLHWIDSINRGRDGPSLVAYTTTSFLYKWEWPQRSGERGIPPRTLKLLKATGSVLLGMIALGLLPWRRLASRPPDSHTPPEPWWRSLLWISAWLMLPSYGFYCASMQDRLPPWRLLGVIGDLLTAHPLPAAAVAIATAGSIYFIAPTWKQRLIKSAIFLTIGLVLIGLCWIVYAVVPPQAHSMWVPRYLGVVWPAFAIAVCVLLMRLPTRPLRWGAVALVITVNLIQHGARVFAGSEPPTDLMASDVLASLTPNNDTRTCDRIPVSGGYGTGMGLMYTAPSRYYRVILSGLPVEPLDFRTSEIDRRLPIYTLHLPAEIFIPMDMARNPRFRRLIVWDMPRDGQHHSHDPLLEKLGPQWHRISQDIYKLRDHWTWRDLYTIRRRVYMRQPAATQASQP